MSAGAASTLRANVSAAAGRNIPADDRNQRNMLCDLEALLLYSFVVRIRRYVKVLADTMHKVPV
jgi:hypothetical protein